ncbi:MAG: response regulator transcription factor [Frankiaceae bacterium]|nr:response regulator transcription factor [Frankiaceae bacterium]
MDTGRLRVFIVDDHEVVRRGVRDLLEAEPDICVVGEAANAKDALPEALRCRPDVAVLDVRLPDGDGIRVCRDLLSALPDLSCLMLTSFADDDALVASIMAGASGYLLKQLRGMELVDAVRTVATGGSLLDPQATSIVIERLRDGSDADPFAVLSAQERRVLELIAEGMTNRQIGEHMDLAEKTVKNYVSALLDKLGLERRTQAAVLVAQNSLRATGERPLTSFHHRVGKQRVPS